MLAQTDDSVADSELRTLFVALQAIYVQCVANPFYGAPHGTWPTEAAGRPMAPPQWDAAHAPITLPSFEKRLADIVAWTQDTTA